MKRTNTAKWVESAQRWQINVQKDGVRKTFTSARPGRTGQREANAKADAWLDEGLVSRKVKVADASEDVFSFNRERMFYRISISLCVCKLSRHQGCASI